jgi:hypothetical protein
VGRQERRIAAVAGAAGNVVTDALVNGRSAYDDAIAHGASQPEATAAASRSR